MKINKQKIYSFLFAFIFVPVLYFVFGTFNKVQAVCNNVVPDPLDPNCDNDPITAGSLINRFIQLLPFVITFLAVIAIVRAAIKIINADDAEGRGEGFKIIMNAVIGLVLFYSTWMILYIIEQATGASIINFGTK